MTVGFVGLGTMGAPMASRLVDAGTALVVWNRTPAKCAPLEARGAIRAVSIDALFAACDVVFLMLLDAHAVDATLGRGSPQFARRVHGRTVVMLGTVSAADSRALGDAITQAGGRYIEAPVSGSRAPAEEGALIGMIAGDDDAVATIVPLLGPMCRVIVRCGAVPSALRTKLAVNHYLIVTVAALAEAFAAARASGVDADVFRAVLDEGPMASAVSRRKLDQLVRGDFTAQAAIRDVAQIARLVHDQASGAGCEAPLIAASAAAFDAALARGLADLDMAAVLQPAPIEVATAR